MLACALFGHRVNNFVFAGMPAEHRHCRCGAAFLGRRETTRVSHTVSCFLFGHKYSAVGERDGHREYVCKRCGHPLLFDMARDPGEGRSEFTKKVRYLCNLFGHEVHTVASRHGLTEYACHCGHSFLRGDANLQVAKHPPICLFAGHFVRFVERRFGHDEYLCRNCGHTFSFVENG
jgi:DNA-directed RNA polymerase subunit RPC12/RpoP